MEVIISRCAGLDIHLESVVATVIYERDGEEVHETRHFGVFAAQRERLCKWLQEEQIEVVVMESTGIYWRNLYRDLELAGLHPQLVNARQAKRVPGRKTDVLDSQWLAKLGRYGLLQPSFVPPTEFQDLRDISRYIKNLTDMAASEKNRIQKILVSSGIYLGNVVTDINGVSSLKIIQGLIDGKPTYQLLEMIHGRLVPKKALLKEALEGGLREPHRQLLKAIIDHIRVLEWQIQEQEKLLLLGLKPYQVELNILQTIPGLDIRGAAMLLVEIGPDMKCFKNASSLASWAGMCPGQNESAGKRQSGKTRKGNVMVRRILCEAAQAASRTNSQFRGKYQSLVIRRGKKRAIVAVGHKLLRVVFALLRDKKPYRDGSVDYEAIMLMRNAPRWIRMLENAGYKVGLEGPEVKKPKVCAEAA